MLSAIRLHRLLLSCCGFLVLAVVLLTAAAGRVQAQSNALFEPLPANQITNATAAQSRQLALLRETPTTASVELIRINIDALRGATISMALPGAGQVQASRQDLVTTNELNFTWIGALADNAGDAILVVHDGNVTGSIRDRGDLYRVAPIGEGVHALIKVDQSKFPPEHPSSFEQIERRGGIGRPSGLRDLKAAGLVEANVLIPYTAAARAAVPDIQGLIRLAVAEANQSYRNSAINMELNLVGTLEIAYSEAAKDWDQVLSDLVNANGPGMPEVRQQRYDSGADMVALIINKPDSCGLADAIMANAATAFALVHYDCAATNYSLAHELGHLMGARHDPAHDPNPHPFAYGHGYQYPPPWRTIMAYDCVPPCVRIDYWSNPNVQYGGVPMGTAAVSDNARVLNETAALVAGFRNHFAFASPATGVIGVTTGSSPAMAALDTRLYTAFQANDGSHKLCVTSSADGSHWTVPAPEYDILIGSAPAMATFNGRLYIAFQSNGPDHKLYVTSSGDGSHWKMPAEGYDIFIGSAPAMAAFNGRLYIAFQANDPSLKLYVTSSADGSHWITPAVGYGIVMGSAPAMAEYGGRLYIAYQADQADHDLYATSSPDGSHWITPAYGYAGISVGGPPALETFNDRLYVDFQANDPNNRLYVTSGQ